MKTEQWERDALKNIENPESRTYRACLDADRLATIEREIKSMIEDYEFYDDEGIRARDTAKHLRAILDPPEQT